MALVKGFEGMNKAVGLIEARGLTTAVSALDAASKAQTLP